MSVYPKVKEVPTSWLKPIPEHWDCKKIGSLFSERKVKVSDKDYQPLSVAKIGVVPQLANAAKTNAGDNRKLVLAGDFVINSRSDRKGSCGVSELDGSVSLINIVLTPREQLNNRYVHYLLRSQPFSEEYYHYGRGIVADLWTTRYSEMKNILLPVPPRSEQDQIVRFLDWKVSEINRLINIKKKEIETLKELLTAEIERQLSLYPLESQVRMKVLGRFEKGGGFSRDNLVEENGYPAVLYGDIYTQYTYKTSSITHNIDETAYGNSPKISKRDIVLAGTGETKDEIGKPILYTGDDIVAAGGDVIIFHPNENINAEYLLYQLYSQDSLKLRYIKGKGDIIVHIYPKDLGNTIIPMVSIENQEKVVESINSIIDKINRRNDIIRREIDALHEYRLSLVSDVVTGQIDVRNIEIPEYDFVDETADTDSEAEELDEGDEEA